ncbi:hypothetical protein [Actinacidiphila paucisporea]|uniref:Uncharacterized protein n=1 Tax=Actinacidiphila paucisporea TaxID=310782 RepID=A0A1M7CQW2_9ACTN|nr:hypothetical protein [Actinacidiphila paucisporea]SHL69582.1 hypothetical protein SAMN05216499_105320 [Actinacidiphila paucisporea]
MTHPATTPPADQAAPWTIARIQNTLTNETLIRRFLLDLTHAPEPRVMEVFAAWQQVAATIEAHAARQPPAATTGLPGNPQNSPAPNISQSRGAPPQDADYPQVAEAQDRRGRP